MGERGPVPKRSDQRVRRNKDDGGPVEKVEVGEPEVDIPKPDEDWHPIAAGWFRSLGESGQSRFFEPSDWAAARYVAQVMTENLEAGRFSASLFSSVWSAMTDLLTTEGARRRARIEIERVAEEQEDDEKVAVMERYRELAAASG